MRGTPPSDDSLGIDRRPVDSVAGSGKTRTESSDGEL